MSDRKPTSSPKSVFEQIEDALGSTAHGRAFLAECERRVRSRETLSLLDAVSRLERRARGRDDEIDRDELLSLVAQVETALRDAKLAFLRAMTSESNEQPSLASFGRETTSSILAAVELIQEAGWKMREAGFDPLLCDRLDDSTSAIYGACNRQDRMLDGLGTVERAIRRADASVAELRRCAMPEPIPARLLAPLESKDPISLIDGDLEFVRRGERDARGTTDE